MGRIGLAVAWAILAGCAAEAEIPVGPSPGEELRREWEFAQADVQASEAAVQLLISDYQAARDRVRLAYFQELITRTAQEQELPEDEAEALVMEAYHANRESWDQSIEGLAEKTPEARSLEAELEHLEKIRTQANQLYDEWQDIQGGPRS